MPGLQVGHATVPGGGSGCTVVLGPFRGAVELLGTATGSRELSVLAPEHVVPAVDALLLTGGSAFGLAAADGVMAWLEERGRGFDTGVARVPIVPAAVLWDLAEGRARPGPSEGRAACDAASERPVDQGAVGAGTGARSARMLGDDSEPGGVGSAAVTFDPWTVGALAVVNALGRVRPPHEAGAGPPPAPAGGHPWAGAAGTNTTLAVVATDAPASRADLARCARIAGNALPRCIHPVGTPFDGDVVFALSTAADARDLEPADVLRLGLAMQDALEQAILRGVGADVDADPDAPPDPAASTPDAEDDA